MNLQELDEIYIELKEIEAILYLFSNLNDDGEIGEYMPIIACHYQNEIHEVIARIEKHL